MKKPKNRAKDRTIKSAPPRAGLTKSHSAKAAAGGVTDPSSKQEHVIALLRSATGATIATMMEATSWQRHSVRGFLAGVIRKRLKLTLESTKVGDERLYRIIDPKKAQRRAA